MPNRREHDHLVANKFKVEIEGVTVGSFIQFSGAESTTEVITYQDGDDMLLRKRPGRTTYSNIVLKRGYISNDELWNWYRRVAEGQVERRSGSIISLDDRGEEILRYNFFEAWPCRWKGMEFDAGTNAALVEEIELVIEKFERG